MTLAISSVRGVITAPVTPFRADGHAIDLDALGRMVERQIDAGIAGLMPCGTTGENASLTDNERAAVVRCTVEAAAGRVPVIVGTGTASTGSTIRLSQQAIAAGADAIMVIVPYYTAPTQEGILAHFAAVHDATDCPIVLYNNPGRSLVAPEPATVEALCEVAPRLTAVKDSSDGVTWCQDLNRRLGSRLAIFCGDDELVAATFAVGAQALASVCANLAPRAFVELVKHASAGDSGATRAAQDRVATLIALVFSEPFPAACKAGLAALGWCEATTRLPLLPAKAALRAALADELAILGVQAQR